MMTCPNTSLLSATVSIVLDGKSILTYVVHTLVPTCIVYGIRYCVPYNLSTRLYQVWYHSYQVYYILYMLTSTYNIPLKEWYSVS